MEQEQIDIITETIDGYPVKNLKWNLLDNIIVGLVKCPIIGRDNLHDGFVSCQWRSNGIATNRYKGRKDLKLKIEWL